MKIKEVLILIVTLLFAFNAVGYAAKSSSGMRTSPSTPKVQQTAPSSQSNYKQSAPANSYSDKAPDSVKPGANFNNPTQQQSSGGFWRNASMFGGGMLLGGLLGNMFGFNMGPMSGIFELMLNILFLIAVFAAVRYLWIKLRGTKNRREY